MKTITTVIVIGLLGVLAAVLYSCKDARDQYYSAMNRCTDARGTWVTANNTGGENTYAGMCIYPH